MTTPVITVIVHEIDTESHPSVPPGWRWAVMVGNGPPSDLRHCAGAGWAPTEQMAWLDGETAGSTACKTARMLGVPASYQLQLLDHDPILPGADRVGIM